MQPSSEQQSFHKEEKAGPVKGKAARRPQDQFAPAEMRSRRWWLFLSLIAATFVGASYFAYVQAPRPDPYAPEPKWTAIDFWRYPLERNAFLRLPRISGALKSVFALPDGSHVWVVGEGGLITHSADGGRTWERQSIVDEPNTPAPAKASSLFGAAWAADAPVKLQTVNPPSPVELPNQPNAAQRQIPASTSQVPASNAPKVNSGSQASNVKAPTVKKGDSPAKSRDATQTPTPPEPGSGGGRSSWARLQEEGLADVFFADALRGWAVGGEGTILATRDGGQSWTPQASGTRTFLQAASFLADGSRGWAVGEGGTILATRDGGQSWTPQASGTSANLMAVRFLADGSRGWAAGQEGTILATRDGGQSWTPQASGTRDWLTAVSFLADGSRGWAAGQEGTILATRDGGQSWTPQASGTGAYLTAVNVLADGRRGWVVGDEGTVLATHDGGESWTSQGSGTGASLYAARFLADGGRGWAVGEGGTILATRDGGQNWTPQARGTRAWLTAVNFLADGSRGWAVGEGGTILATRDRGQNWTPQPSRTSTNLTAVRFLADGSRGWAVGERGTILATRDGGQSWTPQASGMSAHLMAVHILADGSRGWAVGDEGTILATRDGGQSWTPRARGTSTHLTAVHVLADGSRGWAVGGEGTILATRDGGQSWTPQASGTSANLMAVRFLADGSRGWAAGQEGTILATRDGGQSWTPQASGTRDWLTAVSFLADGSRGWAAGQEGTILATRDGGQSWTPQASGTGAHLTAVNVLADGSSGWAVGFGTILATSDGGQHWEEPRYARWPAPWWWLTGLALLGVIAIAATRRVRSRAQATHSGTQTESGTTEEAAASIAEEGVSDRPIGWADPDFLKFKPVARSLSRVLRNADTEPPITIAVTGPWGSGKSSLMNLLREELEGWGYRPVWFNVWHHQQEEHLLAALLEAIRRQLVPAWYSWNGMGFRLRLLFSRSKWYWGALFVLGAILGGSVGYFIKHPERLPAAGDQVLYTLGVAHGAAITPNSIALLEKEKLDPQITNELKGEPFLCKQYASSGVLFDVLESRLPGYKLTAEQRALVLKSAEHVPPPRAMPEFPLELGALLTALLGAPLFGLAVLKGASAFGISPVNFLAWLRGGIQVKGFADRLGLRHRFAEEFRRVTDAAKPKTLLLVVDDLDRCSPANVVKVLETINFLVTAGNCYVVMGMDRRWVEGCVALHYEDVAKILSETKPGADENASRLDRMRFARRYLEKLVNVEVPIPEARPEQTQSLLLGARRRAAAGERRRLPLGALLQQIVRGMRRGSMPRVAYGTMVIAQRVRDVLAAPLARRGVLALAIAAVAVPAGLWASTLLREARPVPQVICAVTETAAPKPLSPVGQVSTTEPRPAVVSRASSFAPGAQDSNYALRFGVGAAVLLLLAGLAWVLRRAFQVVADLPAVAPIVRDTKDFGDALAIWHPWVTLKHRTPRSIKAFKNRVRYLAGAQRVEADPRNLLERLLASARRWLGAGSYWKDPIPEPLLVAMAAIHHCNPDWLEDERGWWLIEKGQVEQLLAQDRQRAQHEVNGDYPDDVNEDDQALATLLEAAIERFKRDFPGQWPPSLEQRAAFRLLATGIRSQVEPHPARA